MYVPTTTIYQDNKSTILLDKTVKHQATGEDDNWTSVKDKIKIGEIR